MSFIIKFFLIFFFCSFTLKTQNYKYILICTSQNCTPCVKQANDFFEKSQNKFITINLFENKSEKQFTVEMLHRYCIESKKNKIKYQKSNFQFGSKIFHANDNGPFLIKYSKNDTIIYDSINIENVN